jgi:hypothetical protein
MAAANVVLDEFLELLLDCLKGVWVDVHVGVLGVAFEYLCNIFPSKTKKKSAKIPHQIKVK